MASGSGPSDVVVERPPRPARPLPERRPPGRPLASAIGAALPARSPIARPWIADATLIGHEDITPEIALFRVRPDAAPIAFVPGQYMTLGLAIHETVVQRPYSTASAPGAAELEFLIRRVPGGIFTAALWETPVGTRVALGRAKGIFTLMPGDERTHLLVATGTGLAPFVAMLEVLRDRPRMPPPVVVHGVAHVAELAYRDRLASAHDRAAIRYVPTVSRPLEPQNAGWCGASGRVTDALRELFATGVLEPRTTIAYLCGNPAMIASTGALLADLGLPSESIVAERYWAPAA